MREVIDTVRKVTGRTVPEIIADRRPGDPPELVADPRKIQEQLGWKAEQDLEAAVRSAWQFKTRRQ